LRAALGRQRVTCSTRFIRVDDGYTADGRNHGPLARYGILGHDQCCGRGESRDAKPLRKSERVQIPDGPIERQPMNEFASEIERLRTKWPQSFAVPPRSPGKCADHLIVVPGVLLPKGYNKTICTVLFLASPPRSPLTDFWVDLPDLLLADGAPPKRSCVCGGPWDGALPCHGRRAGIWDGVPGFAEWRSCRLFLWRVQAFDANRDSIFTSMMVIRQRLQPAR
jgi:hypothetical protein